MRVTPLCGPRSPPRLRGLLRGAAMQPSRALGLSEARSPWRDARGFWHELGASGHWKEVARLRAEERSASLSVLALTAQAMEGDRERFLAAGFDGYLSKPVDIAEFVATVKRYCEGNGR